MSRYKMRQRMISLGDDFTIEDENGKKVFEVDGKVMALRDTFELKDPQGRVLATIRGKLVSLRSRMDVFRDDQVVATITKKLFAPLGDKFQVDVPGDGELRVDGSILDHEYTIRRRDAVIGNVSKRWFSITDTYGIEVAAGEDDALILCIAVALDEMTHDKDE